MGCVLEADPFPGASSDNHQELLSVLVKQKDDFAMIS